MRVALFAAITTFAASVACAPAPAPTRAATTPELGRARRVPLAVERGLPDYVEVELSHDEPDLVFVDAGGEPREFLRPGRATGPVRVAGRLHEGDLIAESVNGELRAAVRLPLETYVAGVVAAELSLWSAEPAELEAQAIAARTFAIATLMRSGRARLTDGVLDQAYDGSYEATASAGSRRAKARLDAAIESTRGLVLMRGEGLEEARYHASCGGATADFRDVFAREVRKFGAAGPSSVACSVCRARARREAEQNALDPSRPLGWIANLGEVELASIGRAAELGGPPDRMVAERRDAHGRWITARLDGPAGSRTVPFDDVRRAAGYQLLPSAMLGPVRATSDGFLIQGRGRGHGVGLCQEALRDLARDGWSAKRILEHYYHGARIVSVDVAMRAMLRP